MHDYLIPIVLGVTGHRRIDTANPKLIGCIEQRLEWLKQLWPHTPFVVVSSLAEGADRLLARLAIEKLGAKLLVPLPFPVEEYSRDFATADSRGEFNSLIARADSVFLVHQKEEHVASNQDARNRQYARAGAWVVEHSQILVAIWDGQPAKGLGGTGDVVQWAVKGDVPRSYSALSEHRNVLSPGDCRIVIQIHPESGEHTDLTGAPRQVLQCFEKIDDFNLSAGRFVHARGEAPLAQSETDLLGNSLGLLKQDAALSRLIRWYSVADSLAARNQKKQGSLIAIMSGLLFLAVSFSSQPSNTPYVAVATVLYIVTMAVVLLVSQLARRWGIEDRFFDYRGLAEGLRVAIFWRMGGVDRKVSCNYLTHHAGLVSWIREAFKSMETVSSSHPQISTPSGEFRDLLEQRWLRAQATYFDHRTLQMRKLHKRLVVISTCGFVLSLVVGACKALHNVAGFEENIIPLGAFGVLIAVGLAAAYYKDKKRYAALCNRYTLSAELYKRAAQRLSSGEYSRDAVVLQIGREALNENADWLWTQRSRPLRP